MISREILQESEYVSHGAYHRQALAIPFHPNCLRYRLGLNLLPEDLKGAFCLDYGGGDGAMATLLADRGAWVSVFDVSPLALSYAQRGDQRLRLVEGKTTLPLASESFDLVFMLEVLEHLPAREENLALAEAFRVLRPRGGLILTVPSEKNPTAAKHYRHYSATGLCQSIEGVGFTVDELIGWRGTIRFPFNGSLGGKLVKGSVFLADWLLGQIGEKSLLCCDFEEADNFTVLAHS